MVQDEMSQFALQLVQRAHSISVPCSGRVLAGSRAMLRCWVSIELHGFCGVLHLLPMTSPMFKAQSTETPATPRSLASSQEETGQGQDLGGVEMDHGCMQQDI